MLTIRPGTRKMKFTVTVNGELVDYGTKYFKGKWSKGKMNNILNTVQNLVSRYEPKRMKVSSPHPNRRSKGLNALLLQIQRNHRKLITGVRLIA